MSEREKLLKKNLCLLQDFCWRNIISTSFICLWNFYFDSDDLFLRSMLEFILAIFISFFLTCFDIGIVFYKF